MIKTALFLLLSFACCIADVQAEPSVMSCTSSSRADSSDMNHQTEPFTFIIFGASGDLTARKLVPAIYNLSLEGHIPQQFGLVGFARRPYTHATFRQKMKEAVDRFSRQKTDNPHWDAFESKIFYTPSDFEDDKGYEDLKALLLSIDQQNGTKGNRVFFLAVHPSSFPVILEKLKSHGLMEKKEGSEAPWSRLIVEKPFGTDFETASALQDNLTANLDESQIFRMDHYLGKEGVLNLISFRFENALFEPLWNSRYIDHVQITMSEEIGIGTRAKFWEETGALRDVLQNHLLQLLTLVAMDPPAHLNSKEMQREKLRLLQAVRPFSHEDIDDHVIRGQYDAGHIKESAVPGYREEEGVPSSSFAETFVAAKLFIDNPRWKGVPFYLKAGKRLHKQSTEILVAFKKAAAPYKDSNALLIRIQPKAGIYLKTLSKVPNLHKTLTPVVFGYQPEAAFGKESPEAYEKLIYDCANGDASLFVSGEEQLATWRILTPVLEHWTRQTPHDFPNYPAGTMGPDAAHVLLEKEGHKWLSIEHE